jgi:hypothetical protein
MQRFLAAAGAGVPAQPKMIEDIQASYIFTLSKSSAERATIV